MNGLSMQNDTALSAHYYTDPGQFDIDLNKIFYRTWQCVCHVSEIEKTGDYVTHSVAGEDVFVIRLKDGRVGGYYNMCRHRGHPLVEGSGRGKKTLTCPYHAWTYDLDGQLKRVPGATKNENVSCSQIKLRTVKTEVFCGFIFVNLDNASESLSGQLLDYENNINSFNSQPELLRFVCQTEIKHQANWKISIENYNECYHCPTVHASSLTRGVLSLDGYTTIPHGKSIWHDGKAQTKNEKQYNYMLTNGPRAGDYGGYWIWPNVSMCFYPGGYFSIRQWFPISYNKTIYRYRWFSSGDIPDEDVHTLMQKHRDTTGAEDAIVVSKIQKSMCSRAFVPGPYILGDGCGAMSEVGVRHFHRLYREAIGVSP